jgi:hypothetical protein
MLGAIFKIESWPGGGLLLLIGVTILPNALIGLAVYKLIKSKSTPDESLDLEDLPEKKPLEKETLLIDEEERLV